MPTYFDGYVILRQRPKWFLFGSLQSDVSVDRGFITKFKNPKFSKLKELKSRDEIINCIQTPETYLPIPQAVEILGNPDIQFIKVRAIKRLKKALNAKYGIWFDVATSSFD
jgi:hypothetical protein